MAALDTADTPRVLGSPARARADAAEARGRELLAGVLRAGDASANLRFVLDNIAGRVLSLHDDLVASNDQRDKLAATLGHLAAICEAVPPRLDALEQRLRAIESQQ
jgi:hypothetical protein